SLFIVTLNSLTILPLQYLQRGEEYNTITYCHVVFISIILMGSQHLAQEKRKAQELRVQQDDNMNKYKNNERRSINLYSKAKDTLIFQKKHFLTILAGFLIRYMSNELIEVKYSNMVTPFHFPDRKKNPGVKSMTDRHY
ncbi:hypothetical protein ACJX0J_011945, partial [Zea mays]